MGSTEVQDSLTGLSIAKRVDRSGHGVISGGIVEKSGDLVDNARGIGPDKAGSACIDGLRPLGRATQHQNGLAQGGGFFLKTTGIRQQQVHLFIAATSRS